MTVLMLVVAGWKRPAPIYEYEAPLTITSTDEPVPQAGPTSTTVLPRASTWLRGDPRPRPLTSARLSRPRPSASSPRRRS